MKKSAIVKLYLLLMIFLASMISCSSDAEPNVTIKIDLGRLSRVQNFHDNKSLIDRFLRFFTTEANAQTAPEGITSIDLTISGPGMSTFTGSYAPDTTTIILAVEAGKSRLFQVVANRPLGNYTGSATVDLVAGTMQTVNISMELEVPHYTDVIINPSFPPIGTFAPSSVTYSVNATVDGTSILSETFNPGDTIQMGAGNGRVFTITAETPSATFIGTANADLTPDATVTLTPAMTLSATKLFIPDYGNARIVQIEENLDDTSWLQNSAVGYMPVDVDYDALGRIYFANAGSADGGIRRINDISDSSYTTIINIMDPVAVAVDHTNNVLYYATNSQLYRANLDGTNPKSDFDMTNITNIRGLDVNDTGLVFIAYGSATYASYDPTDNGVILDTAAYSGTAYLTSDISCKGANAWCAFSDTSGTSFIVELSYSISTNQFTEVGVYQPTTDTLAGPHRILETWSSRIIFTDKYFTTTNRLCVINDIDGTGRLNYTSSGSGPGAFNFYTY